jgi:hypothetical protein
VGQGGAGIVDDGRRRRVKERQVMKSVRGESWKLAINFKSNRIEPG